MKAPKTIFVAADHGGFALKEKIEAYLRKKGFLVEDLGTHTAERCDYPYFAYTLARRVAKGKARGVLVCKSGIGNSIVANRVPGARAALCYNVRAARLSREHNDSNILVLGSLFVNARQARGILNAWLTAKFQGGRHARRLAQLKKIEKGAGCR